jgi:hypothetical protein
MRKAVVKKDVPRRACGQERLPGLKLCTTFAIEREWVRKKRAYHEQRNACGKNRQRKLLSGWARLAQQSVRLGILTARNAPSNGENSRTGNAKDGITPEGRNVQV